MKLNLLQYLWLRLKSRFKKTFSSVDIFDYSGKLQDLVFNEYTMYQMYFDVQKLKKILLNHEAKQAAFGKIKFDAKILLKSKGENLNQKKNLEELENLNDEVSKEL